MKREKRGVWEEKRKAEVEGSVNLSKTRRRKGRVEMGRRGKTRRRQKHHLTRTFRRQDDLATCSIVIGLAFIS